MVRRKSEHNEKEISTLEELSLHQEDIEKIEHLQHWCRHLQILLLQSNLISKIENLGKLKKLKYLNLALNNIERIENLERLESLEKLDLTLNFIGELTSVQNLKDNYNLKYLFLTGNPCVDYKGFREYVITVLPWLEELDSKFIERSDRIIAKQKFKDFERTIILDQKKYQDKRIIERSERMKQLEPKFEEEDEENTEVTAEELDAYWNSTSFNTPEDRIEIAKKARIYRQIGKNEEKIKKPDPVKLFTADGKPLNTNRARIPMTITDDDETGCKVIDLSVYKYLDTSYINVDLHPKYVTISVKNNIVQTVFNEEISVDRSTCQRSQTTGHLVITMPKVNSVIKQKKKEKVKLEKNEIKEPCYGPSKREFLEIGPASNEMDFSRITERKQSTSQAPRMLLNKLPQEKIPGSDFVDNADVPPLE